MNENHHHNDGSAMSPIESEVTLEDVWNEAVREIQQIDPSEFEVFLLVFYCIVFRSRRQNDIDLTLYFSVFLSSSFAMPKKRNRKLEEPVTSIG